MRKSAVYLLLLATALLLPTDAVELGKMLPVETVSIRYEGERLVVETDTENMGVGMTMEEALNDLRETAPGRIYLDTAKYLLVEEAALDQVTQMTGILKDSARICRRKGEVDMRSVGEYLRQHAPDLKLKNWSKGEAIQILSSENGRLKIK